MGLLFVYILKSSLCLLAFYLVYRLLLCRETFHRFNRMVLLGMIFLSLLLPALRLTMPQQLTAAAPAVDWEQWMQQATHAETSSMESVSLWLQLVLWVYIAGILLFFVQFLVGCYRLFQITRRAQKQQVAKGISLFLTDKNQAPFSFWRYIVISKRDMAESGELILAHELAHLRAHHTIDLLLADACILLQWFNPAAWLIKQEMQNIHEYEADAQVLSRGVAIKDYQLLLIKKAVGSQRFISVANSFNHSTLKKRISMMLKRKSSPWARMKTVSFLLPAAIAVAAFAQPEVAHEVEQLSSVKITDLVSKSTPVEANIHLDGSNSTAAVAVASTDSVNRKRHTVTILSADSLKGAVREVLVKSEDVRVEAGSEADVTVVELISEDKDPALNKRVKISKPQELPLVVVDGKIMTMEELRAIPEDQIEMMQVYKDAKAKDMYGEEGANGVIVITLKKEK